VEFVNAGTLSARDVGSSCPRGSRAVDDLSAPLQVEEPGPTSAPVPRTDHAVASFNNLKKERPRSPSLQRRGKSRKQARIPLRNTEIEIPPEAAGGLAPIPLFTRRVTRLK
jgi:hypothetical protein